MQKGYLFILASTLFFSSMEVVLKTLTGQFHPVQMNFTRFLVGGVALLPFAISAMRKRGAKLDGSAVRSFAWLGLLGIAISMTFYQMAVENTRASVVALLFSTNPVFVTFFAFLLLHEPIHWNNVMALILEIIGTIIIIDPFNGSIGYLGTSLALAAALFFGLYGASGKGACAHWGGAAVTCGSFFTGGLELAIVALLGKIPATAAFFSAHGLQFLANVPFTTGYTWNNLIAFLYVSIGVSGFGYVCYFLAMETMSAATASLVFFFKPALAPFLALLVLHEPISLPMAAGICFLLTGSLISLLPELLKGKKQHHKKSTGQ